MIAWLDYFSVMKLTYSNLQPRPRVLKAVTGIGLKEFALLITPFTNAWESHNRKWTLEGKRRQRSFKFRENNSFQCIEDMIIFILYNYKANPTQELLGVTFNLTQPKVSLWIKALEPILIDCLKKLKLVPVRDSDSLNHELVESVTVILDGTERPVRRPKYDQREFFSGKKRDIR